MQVEIKRVYEEPSEKDGVRLLVDRLWPRGIRKEDLHMSAWLKEIAPSNELRVWFHQDRSRFKEFEKRYVAELEANKAEWKPLLDKYAHKKITLLYAAKDAENNHAQCLKAYLRKLYA